MKRKEFIFGYLEEIAELIPAPFYWLDIEGRWLGLNTIAMEGIGVTNKADLIGKDGYETYNNRAIVEKLQKIHNKVIKMGKFLQSEDKIVHVATREFKYFSATRAPLRSKKGEIIGVIGTSIEITKEKEAQKEMFNQIFTEKETLKAEVERFRHESEFKQIECQMLQAEKESQARVTRFVNKMMHEIQAFRIEELHRATGIKPPINDVDRQTKLTKREKQILYLLSMNKSPKNIAQIITIIENSPVSDSTINAIINKKLYPKFEVFNIGQLVEKAIMLNQIPFLLDNSTI
ncbi:MAG: Sensory box histidine kinase/response regulator [Burkholderiales bacterium]|jgi:PAS domain S-box-containing protein|nr:Sensory box histidine kinase/response regulator [Burkholderiales bacterium]